MNLVQMMNEALKPKRNDVSENRDRFYSIQIMISMYGMNFFFVERRLDFEKRRKLHYNEFEAIKLARKLIEEDEDDENDDTAVETKTNLDDEASVSKNAENANKVNDEVEMTDANS